MATDKDDPYYYWKRYGNSNVMEQVARPVVVATLEEQVLTAIRQIVREEIAKALEDAGRQ